MSESQNCNRCRKELELNLFTNHKGKVMKRCNRCRDIDKTKRVHKKEQPSEFQPNKRKLKLRTKMDKLKLNYIINEHKAGNLEDIGQSFVKNTLINGDGQLSLLVELYNDLDDNGELTSTDK
jgi:hypothetical protein